MDKFTPAQRLKIMSAGQKRKEMVAAPSSSFRRRSSPRAQSEFSGSFAFQGLCGDLAHRHCLRHEP